MKTIAAFGPKLKNLFLAVFFSLLIWGIAGPAAGQVPTPTTSPTPDQIPTLNEYGNAIMYLLLALAAIWFILRRQKEA